MDINRSLVMLEICENLKKKTNIKDTKQKFDAVIPYHSDRKKWHVLKVTLPISPNASKKK